MSDWTFLTKFIIVGDQSVGKSAILIRLTEQRFLHNTEATIGVEFGSHLLALDNGDRIKIQVWDTAGSEAFRSITRSYYRGAAGALLVFSLVHRNSFLHVQEWLSDVREHAEENVSIVLVGNMADLADAPLEAAEAETSDTAAGTAEADGEGESARPASAAAKKRRQVTREEAEEFAKREGLIYIETSAKTGQNIEEAFHRTAREVHRKFLAAQAAAGTSAGGSAIAAPGTGTGSTDPSGRSSGTGTSAGGSAASGFLRMRGSPAAGGAASAASRRSRIQLGAEGEEAKKGCCVVQ